MEVSTWKFPTSTWWCLPRELGSWIYDSESWTRLTNPDLKSQSGCSNCSRKTMCNVSSSPPIYIHLLTSCVLTQGLHPSKDPAFAVFKGKCFRETLLTGSTIVKWESGVWSISWLRHQMFYPYITISAAQASESYDLHHAMSTSTFSLFFFRHAKNLGICEATKDSSGASSKNREKKAAFGGAFELGQPSRSVVT